MSDCVQYNAPVGYAFFSIVISRPSSVADILVRRNRELCTVSLDYIQPFRFQLLTILWPLCERMHSMQRLNQHFLRIVLITCKSTGLMTLLFFRQIYSINEV
jgi:hypothetical protein